MRYFKVKAAIEEIIHDMPGHYIQKMGLASTTKNEKLTYVASDENTIIDSIATLPGFEEINENPVQEIGKSDYEMAGNFEIFENY